MAKQNFWAVQAHTKEGKALSWHYKNSKTLYFTLDKKSPPPALFDTRGEAVKAISRSRKSREKSLCKILFTNEIECKKAQPIRININILN